MGNETVARARRTEAFLLHGREGETQGPELEPIARHASRPFCTFPFAPSVHAAHRCLHAEGCGDGGLRCVGSARQQPSEEVGEAQRD